MVPSGEGIWTRFGKGRAMYSTRTCLAAILGVVVVLDFAVSGQGLGPGGFPAPPSFVLQDATAKCAVMWSYWQERLEQRYKILGRYNSSEAAKKAMAENKDCAPGSGEPTWFVIYENLPDRKCDHLWSYSPDDMKSKYKVLGEYPTQNEAVNAWLYKHNECRSG
jgi:hypothetical protein